MKQKQDKLPILIYGLLVILMLAVITSAFVVASRMNKQPKQQKFRVIHEDRIDGSTALPEEVPEHLVMPKHQ